MNVNISSKVNRFHPGFVLSSSKENTVTFIPVYVLIEMGVVHFRIWCIIRGLLKLVASLFEMAIDFLISQLGLDRRQMYEIQDEDRRRNLEDQINDPSKF